MLICHCILLLLLLVLLLLLGFVYWAYFSKWRSRLRESPDGLPKKNQWGLLSLSLSLYFNGHFPGEPGLADRCLLKQRMMEVVVTTGAICHAKLQSNHYHQQSSTKSFYRPEALPVAQPTVSKHWREKCHIPWTCLPQTQSWKTPRWVWGPNSSGGFPTLCLTINGSRLPWGRVAMPFIGHLAPCGLRGCKNWPALFPGRMS